jgi:hypothetical protein
LPEWARVYAPTRYLREMVQKATKYKYIDRTELISYPRSRLELVARLPLTCLPDGLNTMYFQFQQLLPCTTT